MTDPREADTADSIRQHISEDWWIWVASGEVRMKPRMLPVGYLHPHTAPSFLDRDDNDNDDSH